MNPSSGELAEALREVLLGFTSHESLEDEGLWAIDTFDEVGMLTLNAGLVLRFRDGREFQLSIVGSRRSGALRRDSGAGRREPGEDFSVAVESEEEWI